MNSIYLITINIFKNEEINYYIYYFIRIFSSCRRISRGKKKRIMRKYLREQVIVFNSDLVVENSSNKEAIKDSEKMKIIRE